jgi:hypothetical protein
MAPIKCSRHGSSKITATVCGHLTNNKGASLGFVENCSDPEDKQGWCYACELVFSQEQDKTPRFERFTQFTVVCSKCYDDIKTHHDFDAAAAPFAH